MEVTAFWGYGSGFVARGRGRIVKVFPKSVRVELTEDVDYRGEVGWVKGFVLQGIPKFPSPQWNEWHRVVRLPDAVDAFVSNAVALASVVANRRCVCRERKCFVAHDLCKCGCPKAVR